MSRTVPSNAVRVIAGVAAAALAIGLTACSSSNTAGGQSVNSGSTSGGSTTGTTSSSKTCTSGNACKVALIISDAGLGDKGFNDLANAGMKKAVSELKGATGKAIQDPQIDTHGVQDLTQAAQAGYGLVIDLDYGTSANLVQVAKKFPKTHFVLVDNTATGANITSQMFYVQDSSYLSGMVAALAVDSSTVNKTGKKIIGAIGGIKSPGIDEFLVGYEQGARAVDPKIQVKIAYANNFADPTIGANLANSMYDQGALVVYQVAGVTGLGVLKAAKQRNRYAIGVDSNQDADQPGHVLTSSLKRTDTAVYDAITDYAKGTLQGGKTVYYGLPNGVGITDLKYTKSLFTAAQLAKVQAAETAIENKTLKVWDVPTQGYPSWFTTK